jgi:gamma-glutamyltranspeptidase/glutathione hydrolase
MPDLAASLMLIAEEGPSTFYRGRLMQRMAADLSDRGSMLTERDFTDYEAVLRAPLVHEAHDWAIATNPSPAIGGEALVAILERLGVDGGDVAAMAEAQFEVFSRRRMRQPLRSPATIQLSAVDEDGGACSITASSGYGSGVIPSGTGIWMNNALGELELVPEAGGIVPGTRLVSNMAPTVCRSGEGAVVAIGSPGADRITSALAQVLDEMIRGGRSLHDAISEPRLHVAVGEDGSRRSALVSVEPGLELDGIDLTVRRYPEPHMFFGGVSAAMFDASGRLSAHADPRRDGAAGVSS